MRNIKAVFTKQFLSYVKNPGRWVMSLTFLLIPFILSMVNNEGVAIFTIQFVIMFVGLSMIGGSAGMILEDKETMNLRFMGMAGVKPYQYLISTCGVLLIVSLGVLTLFGLIRGHSGEILVNFLIVTMLGVSCSILLGITLGLSKLAPFTWIVAILLGIGPVMANDFGAGFLSQVFYFSYTYQIDVALRGSISTLPDVTTIYELSSVYNIADMYELRAFLRELRTPRDLAILPMGSIRILLINMAVILLAFVVTNLRYGLDGERLVKARNEG